jgi:hypothetical protein
MSGNLPMLTPEVFFGFFPEFQAPNPIPTATVQQWLDVASQFINAQRWNNSANLGACLFAAHWISLGIRAAAESANGAPPGTSVGVVSSKSVGPVSVSYDVAAATNPEDSHWNQTTYGTRYQDMSRLFGAGPIQVGTPGGTPPLNGPAWGGPLPWGW